MTPGENDPYPGGPLPNCSGGPQDCETCEGEVIWPEAGKDEAPKPVAGSVEVSTWGAIKTLLE
jgi:hypothetical protein